MQRTAAAAAAAKVAAAKAAATEAKRKAAAAAAAKTAAANAAAAAAAAAVRAKNAYKPISSREFAKVCKDPDAHVGRTFILWGEVTQFDSATGTDAFRANTGATRRPIEYGMTDYEQNSVMAGNAIVLSDVVQGDCFGAKVKVLGSLTYDTQIGGSTTVPNFEVVAITPYGSTK